MIFGPRSERSALIVSEQLSLDWMAMRRTPPCRRPPMTTRRRPNAKRGKSPQSATQYRRSAEHLPRASRRSSQDDGVPVLRRPPSPHRRDRQRNPGPSCGGAARIAHDPAEIRCRVVKKQSFRPRAATSDRKRNGLDRARRLGCRGEIRLGLDALSSGADPGRPRRLHRSSDAGRWMKRTAWMLKGLYLAQIAAMHAHPRLFCDETPVRVLDPGRGRTKICQFWAHATDDRSWKGPRRQRSPISSRAAGQEGDRRTIGWLRGVLQVDGYAAYTALAGDKTHAGKIQLAFCLVHARRNFVKVHKTTNSPSPRKSSSASAPSTRSKRRSAPGRRPASHRAAAETKPLMEALKARFEETRMDIARLDLVKAIDYALERWLA